ncbi:dTDP-4-dehydrorhamnose reductase [Dokdonella koreensis]|uniref:dTDP-4-dehydrorhamnose reductase n=1 Tax=Dokdonella koreensis DS-123 TaxID=1300342 RepID=A0A160DXT4_9GAMM|nr:dTDP-4-dehydrorhamnose reductase [Dokdonella koreensis]ANB19131.1 dTDP-4-dehydrorhamnose reductase [Dokdonella koreensis DS-123]
MRILLLGANGQVGRSLQRPLAGLGEVICATRDGRLDGGGVALAADLGDPAGLALALDAAAATVIVNAAAYTAVDRAESEPDRADRINHRAVGEIGAWAASHGAAVVHYSTDYVFDGRGDRPYREDDPVAPLGAYGRSKQAGEQALQASGAEQLILRTAWVYAAHGHNFLRTMLRLAGEREELRIVADQVGSPTPAGLIAGTTAALLARWRHLPAGERGAAQGVYHLTAAGACSWFDFAQAIFERAHAAGLLPRRPRVVPIASADYPTPAQRPAWSVLDCERLQTRFGLHLPAWEQGLREVVEALAAARSA